MPDIFHVRYPSLERFESDIWKGIDKKCAGVMQIKESPN